MIRESLEDFRKRYKGTYLFLKVRGKDMLVRYESDNEEDFCFYSATYGDILVDEETARENITLVFPPMGLYNVDGQAYVFTRVPARQWKRAPCEDNVLIFPILGEINLNVLDKPITMPSMEQVFFPHYEKSLDKALLTNTSIALSLNFAVSASNKDDQNQRILWFQNSPIGIINIKEREIHIKFHAFYQETLDFFRKGDFGWTILKR